MSTQEEINAEMNAAHSAPQSQSEINAEMNASQQNISSMGNGSVEGVVPARTGTQVKDDLLGWTGETMQGFGSGYAQGLAMENADEAEGLIQSVFDKDSYTDENKVGGTYEKHRQDSRNRYKRIEDESGWAFGAGKVAGLITPWAAATGIKMGGTAVLGGLQGALEYIGGAEELDDVEAGKTLGYAALAAVPAEVITGGVKVFRSVFGAKSKDQVADILAELKAGSGLTEAEIMQEAHDMGGDLASLVDVTGGSGVAFGQGLLGTSKAGMRQQFKKHLEKIAYSKKRITSVMEEVTGKGKGAYFATLDALKLNRKNNANELYGEAIDNARLVITPQMSKIMNRNPTVREAWTKLQQKYDDNGVTLQSWGKTVDGKVQEPDVGFTLPARVMQEFKWEMDALARRSSSGIDSASQNLHQNILDDRNAMMNLLYKQNPSLKKADAMYAGDSAMIAAQEQGYKAGLGGEKLSLQLEAIKKLSGSEKDAYLQGLMSRTYDKMGTTAEEVLGNVARVANENSMEVLTALTGKEGARRILSSIGSEKRFRSVENQLLGGSQTELRASAKEAFQNISDRPTRGVVDQLTDVAKEIPYLKKIRHEMTGQQQLTNAQRDELAELMMTPGGVGKALERLKKAGQTAEEASMTLAILRGIGSSAAPMISE